VKLGKSDFFIFKSEKEGFFIPHTVFHKHSWESHYGLYFITQG